MEKFFIINFNIKQNLMEEIAKRKVKILFKTQNSVIIKSSEVKANQLAKLGYKVQEVRKNLSRLRGAKAPITINKLKGNKELREKESATKTYFYLLKFIGPVQYSWLQKLKKHKIIIAKTLTDFSFIIKGKPGVIEKIRSRTEIIFVLPYHPILKIHPSLLGKRSRNLNIQDLQFKNINTAAMPFRLIEIVILKGENTKKIAALINKLGHTPEIVDQRIIRVETGTKNIAEYAQIEGIDTIYPYYPGSKDNDISAGLTQVADVRVDEELDGRGQIVGVYDSGLDTGVNDATMHVDFQGRIVNLTGSGGLTDFSDTDGHGTHVAGTVCGDGSANAGAWPGMAPAAQLAFIAHGNSFGTADMIATFDTMVTNGALVVNNSWGSGSTSVYNTWSELIDEYVWDNRNFLPVFTAGNSGRDNDSDGVTDADALRSTGAAKNCICVGASENNRPNGSIPDGGAIGAVYSAFGSDPNIAEPLASDDISDNPEGMHHRSSRGPTDDGRIKPDIVAIGTNVLSCRSSAYVSGELNTYFPSVDPLSALYAFNQGTSMAAPQIAGIAILIRQYLAERRGHSNPSAALLKAIIINGAYELQGQYNAAATNPHNDAGSVPNSIQGWGRANIMDSLFPAGTGRIQFSDRLEYALMTGETKIFEVHVNSSANPMSVCMVYTDAPGAGIINQLYLQVEQPDGSFLDGDYNIDNTTNPYSGIAANGVINNVQKVNIVSPAVGNYRIHVQAYSVSVGISPSPRTDLASDIPVQDFALVVANATGFSAHPISVMQVFDRSGSMNHYGYADPAKQRAKEFADFLQINDKHGVVSFNASATEEYANTLISNSGDIEDAKNAIDVISIGGRTSIGAGVELAQSLFDSDGLPHAMVLFSDGFSNEPPYAVSPPDASSPIIDPAFIATGTVIHTIALGSTADSTRLSDIATQTGGNFYTIDSLANIYELNEIYYNIQSLTGGAVLLDYGTDIVPATDSDADHIPDKRKARSIKMQNIKSSVLPQGLGTNLPSYIGPFTFSPILNLGVTKEIPFTVDLSTQIRVCVSTNQANADFNIYATDPDGLTHSQWNAGVRYIVGDDYKHLIIELPKAGAWTLKVQSLMTDTLDFSYAIFSDTINDLEVAADEYVKTNTNPVFEIAGKLGDLIITNQNIQIFTKGNPKAATILNKNKSALSKIKINAKTFGDPVNNQAKLELLNQQIKAKGKASLFKSKTSLESIVMAKKEKLKVEVPKMSEADSLRHDIAISGSYSQNGVTYAFTRKKMICQQVRSKIPAAGALKIVEIWNTYQPSKLNNSFNYQKLYQAGRTIVGVKVTGPKGRPMKLSDKYSFTPTVTINGKKIAKLNWIYKKTSQSFIVELPKAKGLVVVTARLKVKNKTRTKKLSWKQ